MIRIALFAASLLVGASLAGCSEECSSALDCSSNEVCYRQVCTPAASVNALCRSDEDCNPGGGTVLECQGGRCRVNPTFMPGLPDATVPDSSVPPMDSGVMGDAGTSTTTDGGS